MGSAVSSLNGGWYISLAVYVFLATCVGVGALIGLKRGAPKSTVRIITIVSAAMGAFLLTALIMRCINSFFEDKTLEEAIRALYPNYDGFDESVREFISFFDAETAEYVLMIPVAVLFAPMIFVCLFISISLLMLVVYKIFTSILGMNDREKNGRSIGIGAAIGSLQGLIIAVVLLIPLAGLSGVAASARENLTAEELPDDVSEATEAVYCDWIDGVSDNVALKAIRAVGGDAAFSALTRVHIDGEAYSVRNELCALSDIYRESMVLKDANWTHLSENSKEHLDRIIDLACDDGYTAGLISGLLRGASGAIEGGVIDISMEEPYRSLCMTGVHVFSDSNKDNLGEVARTLVRSYCILSDGGILDVLTSSDEEAILDVLSKLDSDGQTVMTKFTSELNSNPKTAPLTTAITKVSLAIMSDSLKMDEEAAEIYENVKTEVNNILAINKEDYETEEEYTEAVSEQLNSALMDNGINLEKEIVDDISKYIVDNYSDKTEATDEDINMAILHYYDAYAKYLEEGELPSELPSDLPAIP